MNNLPELKNSRTRIACLSGAFLGLLAFSLIITACDNGSTGSSPSFEGIIDGTYINAYRQTNSNSFPVLASYCLFVDGTNFRAYSTAGTNSYEGTFSVREGHKKIYFTVKKHNGTAQTLPYIAQFNFDLVDPTTFTISADNGTAYQDLGTALVYSWIGLSSSMGIPGNGNGGGGLNQDDNDNNGGDNTGDNGNGNGIPTSPKPSHLAETASYEETMAKLDEIIAYCEKNNDANGINNGHKLNVQSKQKLFDAQQSVWDSVGPTHIQLVNTTIIDLLQ